MVSFNLVFHLASAIACVLLIYALLRLQSLVRFHGQLWQSLDPARKLVQLDWPAQFVHRFGKALGIPVAGEAGKGAPARIEMGVWVTAHLQLRFLRMSWQAESSLLIEVRDADQVGAWPQALEHALGGAVKIQVRKVESQSIQGV